MIYLQPFRLSLFLLLTSILFYLYPYGTSGLGQAREIEEHEVISPISPCGNPNTDLTNLTGFFEYRWQATYVDLYDKPMERWIEHHGLENQEIVKVRIFTSPVLPKVAVVGARRFVNYLNGQILVDVHCVVLTEDGRFVRQYNPDELEKILTVPGTDT